MLGAGQRSSRTSSHFFGVSLHLQRKVLSVQNPLTQSQLETRFRVQNLGQRSQLKGFVIAHRSRQQPRSPGVGNERDAREGLGKAGRAGPQPNVARERQIRARARCDTVHCCNDGSIAMGYGQNQTVVGFLHRFFHVACDSHRRQILSGTEATSHPSDD